MKYDFPIIMPTIVCRIRDKWSKLVSRLRARWLAFWWGLRIGKGVRFEGRTLVRTRRRGSVIIGNGTIFNANPLTNLVGLSGPTILDVLGGGRIKIGDNSGFSSVVISSRSAVDIGNHVKVGGNTRIFDHDYHSLDANVRRSAEDRLHIRTSPIVIDDDCFIGTNAHILKGTHLGARSIVAAGSVVFGLDVPPDSLVKGNPARIVSSRHG